MNFDRSNILNRCDISIRDKCFYILEYRVSYRILNKIDKLLHKTKEVKINMYAKRLLT